MKKHSISIILALVICFSSLFVSAHAALALGDVDGKGGVTANDARFTLRASVGLEKLNAEQKKAADAKTDGKITADDARLILRAAVGLEKLHAHSYKSEVTKAATCTEKGIKTYKCSCGDSYTEAINTIAHTYTERTVILKEATCIAGGQQKKYCKCGASVTEAIPTTIHIFNMEVTKQPSTGSYGTAEFSCSVCSHKESIKLCTHTAKSMSIDKTTKCSTSGCEGQIPSFNYLVNSLKASRLNKFSGFTKSTTVTQKATATPKNGWYWALAEALENLFNMDIKESTDVKYSDLTYNRPFIKTTFHVTNQPFISNLKQSDIKSISITKMNGIDFVKNLPSSYNVTSSLKVDLSKIKASQIGSVYKVRVVLPTEKISKNNLTENDSPIERIYESSYHKEIKSAINEFYTDLNSLASEIDFLSVDASAVTNCTVDYYFTANSFDPVCATYSVDTTLNGDMYVYVNDDGQKQDSPTVTISLKAPSSQQSYYFFNNHFTIK